MLRQLIPFLFLTTLLLQELLEKHLSKQGRYDKGFGGVNCTDPFVPFSKGGKGKKDAVMRPGQQRLSGDGRFYFECLRDGNLSYTGCADIDGNFVKDGGSFSFGAFGLRLGLRCDLGEAWDGGAPRTLLQNCGYSLKTAGKKASRKPHASPQLDFRYLRDRILSVVSSPQSGCDVRMAAMYHDSLNDQSTSLAHYV